MVRGHKLNNPPGFPSYCGSVTTFTLSTLYLRSGQCPGGLDASAGVTKLIYALRQRTVGGQLSSTSETDRRSPRFKFRFFLFQKPSTISYHWNELCVVSDSSDFCVCVG
ncbi:hypothetical protein Q1695_006220 [Nippostrongylus brasiliensis]|nr:hypothetical protein Q1695_006220 [Nippostrongylus brasiliensis]